MAYPQSTELTERDSGSLPKTEPIEQCCIYYVKLCADYDALYMHIGHMCILILSGMCVSHATAPSAWLDFVLKYLESRAKTVRHLSAEMFA